MKILILGADAIDGCFGSRLHQGGAAVTLPGEATELVNCNHLRGCPQRLR